VDLLGVRDEDVVAEVDLLGARMKTTDGGGGSRRRRGQKRRGARREDHLGAGHAWGRISLASGIEWPDAGDGAEEDGG
jgi:hypothetical protein